MPEVLIYNVHKSFGAVEVLKGVSLSSIGVTCLR
ncbi:polar amino acid transport system ATP-binding protein [Mesorhizobium muleiense]|uniref:Polar amino acid transport system ATP-binding protein n=1 Tax=Mesorhizobium muleiense TaxID=1004279 RepID=A0A1G8W0Z7_9HYPH|nr:polar amino acid transport system ATP-binding protein [Mesorhizobium muleiense]